MKILLNLLHRELIVLPRTKFYYIKRIISIILFIILFISFYNFSYSNINNNLKGSEIFNYVIFILTSLIIFIAPLDGSSAISSERRNKTLDLLILCNLSYFQIIIAKLISKIIYFLSLFFLFTPILLLCVLFGGISVKYIIYGNLQLFSMSILFLSYGILCGTFFNPYKADNISISSLIFLIILNSIGVLYLMNELDYHFIILSPILSIGGLYDCKIYILILNITFNVIVTSGLIFLSTYFLKRNFIEEKILLPKKIEDKYKKFKFNKRKTYKIYHLNPIYWKDIYINRNFIINLIKNFIILIFILFPLKIDLITDFFILLCLTLIFIFTNLLICIAKEKEEKTWEILILTNLTPLEIILGKIKSILRKNLIYIIILIILLIACMNKNKIFIHNILKEYFFWYLISIILFYYSLALFSSWISSNTKSAFINITIILVIYHTISNSIFYFIYENLKVKFNDLMKVWIVLYFLLSFIIIYILLKNLKKPIKNIKDFF